MCAPVSAEVHIFSSSTTHSLCQATCFRLRESARLHTLGRGTSRTSIALQAPALCYMLSAPCQLPDGITKIVDGSVADGAWVSRDARLRGWTSVPASAYARTLYQPRWHSLPPKASQRSARAAGSASKLPTWNRGAGSSARARHRAQLTAHRLQMDAPSGTVAHWTPLVAHRVWQAAAYFRFPNAHRVRNLRTSPKPYSRLPSRTQHKPA